MRMIVSVPFADVREAPDANALRGKFETQLIFGEEFVVETEQDAWCYGFCAHDGYKGCIEKRHIQEKIHVPTHVICAHTSWIYRDATMKSPPLACLGFGSRITLTETGEKFSCLSTGGWIFNKHVSPIETYDNDYVSTAIKFLETPYFWGGRSAFGIDCSGLVQIALARAGVSIPRDTEQQINAFGMQKNIAAPLQRGDIVYFEGHVGIMLDDTNLLHATAHYMKVCIEPLDEVCKRSRLIHVIGF